MGVFEFITAKEAKMISDDYKKDNLDYEELKEINKRIRCSSQNGKRMIMVDKVINWYCIEFLESLGYYINRKNGQYYINW